MYTRIVYDLDYAEMLLLKFNATTTHALAYYMRYKSAARWVNDTGYNRHVNKECITCS